MHADVCDLDDCLAIVIIALCESDRVSGDQTMMGKDWPQTAIIAAL